MYKVYRGEHISGMVPDQVTFTDRSMLSHVVTGPGDPELPTVKGPLLLPNPTYLRIHAACCKIARLSGIAEALYKAHSRLDAIQCLSSDGSSADVLYYALLRSSSYAPSRSP